MGEKAELLVVEGGWGLHYIDEGKGEAARMSSMQMAKRPILTPKDAEI